MKSSKRKLIGVLLTVAVMTFGFFALTGCLTVRSGNSVEKSFTISCPTQMEAGERIEIKIKKSYDFDMKHDDYEWKIVGENTVDGSFEFEDLDKYDNYTNKFFRANLPGKVQIQATNYTSGLLTSNIVEITVVGNMINTVGELKAIANTSNAYMLGSDIDISSENSWTPIEGFTGTLNGRGHSIKNLSLKVKSGDNVGLFGELKGTVRNVKLENLDISGSGSGSNVGGIAGKNNGTITSCEVSGTINCEYAVCVGGIAGYSNANLLNNVNNASVTSNEKVGGVVGCVGLKGTAQFGANVNKGAVSGATSVGGIAGAFESTYSEFGNCTATISDCENEGVITATSNYAGGIAGQALGARSSKYTDYKLFLEISDCENKGAVSGKDYVGGIYGNGGNYVKSVTACVNGVDIVGNNYAGGYIGYSANTATSNMNNNNSITGKGYVGGIAGYTGNVQNCKNNGTITSLGTIFEDDTNKYCVGGIAGYCTGATNCENSVDITVDLAGSRVGGIAGSVVCAGAIESNTNSGKITASKSTYVGGIAGRVLFDGERAIKGNTNESDVSGASYVGGIAGTIVSTYSAYGNCTATISDCENKGAISATGDYAGGIAGQAAGVRSSRYTDYHLQIAISNNTNSGSVIAGSANTCAAIIGKAGSFVNSQNSSLWSSNNDTASVGKIYN